MTATTHECPAPGCCLQVPFAKLVQGGFRIPPALRHRLLREYANNFGEHSYFETRAECLAALGVPDEQIAALNGGVARREAVPQ